MEVHLAPEIESQLRQMAILQGKELPQLVEETFSRAWAFIQEQDEWLVTHRNSVDAQIQTGIAELERGEGIPEEQLDDYLARLEARPE